MMTREEIDDRLAKLPAWKVQKFYELKKRHEEYSKSPELISRAEFRKFQWKVYEEMGMRAEEIVEEII